MKEEIYHFYMEEKWSAFYENLAQRSQTSLPPPTPASSKYEKKHQKNKKDKTNQNNN